MADVFLSYARVDRAIAEQVKAGLEAAGLSVFFDVEGLDGGDVFPDVLDREVKGAGAVVSLWSQHSLSRPWVKQECSIGLKRKCLVPLAIEALGELDVPVAFEGLQQIDFTGFHGRTDSPEWRKLMRSLSRTLGRPELVGPAAGSAAPVARAPAAGTWTGWPKLVTGIAAFAAVVAVIGFGVRFVPGFGAEKAPVEAEGDLEAAGPEGVPTTVSQVPAEQAVAAEAKPSGDGAAVQPAGVVFADEGCGDADALIYFDFDKTNLKPEAISVLEEAMTRSFGCELLEVRVEAHDDLQNSPSYAEALSSRRAATVAAWLTSNGASADQVTTIGYGSSQPLEPGKRTPANRRASVFFDYADPA